MAKIRFDDIEIVEPPLKELTKKSSFFRISCLSGCGCLLLVLVGGLIGWRIIFGSHSTKMTSLPQNFPASIPIYNRDAIERVNVVQKKYQERREALATIISHMITGSDTNSSTENTIKKAWEKLTATSTSFDIITIAWSSTAVKPPFVSSYYKKELQDRGYLIEQELSQEGIERFFFFNTKEEIRGSFSAEPLNLQTKNGTYVILEVIAAEK
jgi:predicted nucleic-acid-binding protein